MQSTTDTPSTTDTEYETRKTRIKNHLQTHKTTYIAGTTGIIVGAAGATLLIARVNPQINVIRILSSGDDYITQITELVRRGHPGYVVKCIETGETFASQGRAAELLKLSASDLSKHLNGMKDAVKGLHFARIAEMPTQPLPV